MADQGPAGTRTEPTSDPSARTVSTFVRLWAVAHVVHLTANSGARLDSPWSVLVVASAITLLLRPGNGRVLALMAAAQLADMVAELPLSPDHWMLVSFVDLALLATMAWRRSTDPTATAAALPAARAILLMAYGAAALAKYNTAFLDPSSSCATDIAHVASFGLADRLHAAPLWGPLVLAVETAIPLLLAVPVTRRHGVRLAMAFHFVLSVSPAFAVVDFTVALYALFFLFLPERDVEVLLARIGWATSRSAIVRDARRAPRLTAVLAFLLFGFSGWASLRVGAGVVYVASQIFVLALLLAALTSWRAGSGARPFGARPFGARPFGARPFGRLLLVQVPAVVLLAVWISQPYLGGRTTAVFTMFSGIRTEGAAPNHLFLPAYRLTDWQDEFVVVTSSNAPDLQDVPEDQFGVPLLALRRMAMDDPDLTVVGTMNGEKVTFGPGAGQRRFEPLPWWQYKLLYFRPVAVGEKRFCTVS